ncbi:unnamed protein product [Symbiodinium sp. CCMP2592]|nr:unnamed protein product [Symbiodinium sp. CCMP2592]
MARAGPVAKHSPVMRPEVSRPYPVLLGTDRKDRVTSQNSRKQPAQGRRSDLKEASEFCQKHSVDPASGRLRRRNETGGRSTVPESAPKREIAGEPLVSAKVELEYEPDEDQRKYKELIVNWNIRETLPLPIQPVGSTLRTIPEGTDEANDEEPFMMHSYDLFVFCGSDAVVYGCFDSPDLNYDDYFSMPLGNSASVASAVLGKNECIALRGLHDHPVITGYILEDHTQPSRRQERPINGSGFCSMDAQFVVTHSVDTTAIWRLDRLWQVAEAAALGHKKDPRKPLDLMETMENKSQLSECRAELWLKNSEGMYPVRRDKAQAFVAIVGEYLPGKRSATYRPDDGNGGVVLKMDSSGLLILTVARGPEIDVYAILPHTLDVVPVTVVDTFSLDSSLELVFPEVGGRFRGLRARLEQPDSATTSYDGDYAAENKDSPPPSSKSSGVLCSTPPGLKSPGSTPPSSVKGGAPPQPRPKSKAGVGQHQVRTPRGASLHSTNIGRGGLARQISSRGGLALDAEGLRKALLRGRARKAADAVAEMCGTGAEQRPKRAKHFLLPGTVFDIHLHCLQFAAMPIAWSQTSRAAVPPARQAGHASGASKTVRRDVKPLLKAATSEGVRLRSRSASTDKVDRRQASPKLVETPPRPESVEPVHKAGAPSTPAQTSYVASPQTSCAPVAARIPAQRFAVAAPSGRGSSGAVPVNQPRLQGLSSWPSVWVPQVIPAVPAVPVQVPVSMVSRSSLGHHFAYSRSSFATVATAAYPSAGVLEVLLPFQVATAAGSGNTKTSMQFPPQSDMTMMLSGQASSVIFSSSKTGNSDITCRLEHAMQPRIPNSQISDDSRVEVVVFELETRVVKT